MNVCGIYRIINPKGKIYVGKSKNIKVRFNSYKKLQQCSQQPKLFNSLKKYGPENHIFEIIEECDILELNDREKYWIEYYSSYHHISKNGLNLTLGGDGALGAKKTDEQKKLHSIINTGRIRTKNQKNKVSKVLKNKSKPTDFSSKMGKSNASREKNKTYKKSPPLPKNPSHYLTGKQRPEWVKEKISKTKQENLKPKSEETIQKMRQNNPWNRPVIQYDLEGNFIKEWPSMQEAGRHIDINSTGIYACCKHKQNTAGGFKWAYKDI